MIANWPRSLDFVWEFDGLRNDSAPGEKFTTGYGVTAMTWAEAVAVGCVQGKLTDATQADCGKVLHDLFWARLDCDALPSGVDLVVFNSGMVAGVNHAARLAQRIAGVDEDGDIGPLTLLAIKGMHPIPFTTAFTAGDERFFSGLHNAPLFLAGWDRRANEACRAALKLIPA